MTGIQPGKTAAVVVGYNPDLGVLSRLLRALAGQVDSLILVDNGRSGDLLGSPEWSGLDLTYIDLGRNQGLGAALNIGIATALERGAEFVGLFDQDSAPLPDLIGRLFASHRELAAQGVDCAAVGPVFYDRRENRKTHFPFYRETDGRIAALFPTSDGPRLAQVDALITSGMLVKTEAWQTTARFDEGLYVDYTDTEWCFRIRSLGRSLYANLDLEMGHAPSDAPPARVAGLSFFRYSPIRRYYYFRNTLFFLTARTSSAAWKRRIGVGLFLRFFVNILIDQQKFQSLRMMVRGLWDGARRKGGPWIAKAPGGSK